MIQMYGERRFEMGLIDCNNSNNDIDNGEGKIC